MAVKAPFAGSRRPQAGLEGQHAWAKSPEGEEVRPGCPFSISSIRARCRSARSVNQADVNSIAPGQAAKIRLDAYPDLLFDGKSRAARAARRRQSLTPKVRAFTAIVSIQGSSPQLMPDLSASVEIAGATPFDIRAAPGTR